MEFVTYEQVNSAATITINRPNKRNALSSRVVAELLQCINKAQNEAAVRAVILTGSGSVFSAGADLEALQKLQTATSLENLDDSHLLARLLETIYRCPKPVIAKVNGHAIAGGCGLAAVCDFSIVSQTAKLGFTEVRVGFVPAIVMIFVMRKIGEVAARDLMLRGHLISAQQAADIGLISHVLPADELDQSIQDLVDELVRNTSGSAVALTKKLMADIQGVGLSEALGFAVNMNAFARNTEDCQAGIAAFLNKEPMPWSSE